MEAIMDRYRDEPLIILLKKKHVPMARRYIDTGYYQKAVESYEKLADRLDSIVIREEMKNRIESDLAKGRFDIYRRKDEGLDIAEPLSIFTQAQKRFTEGKVLMAEYLLEVSRKYCDNILAT
jgi:fructose-bisphosphate aldolase class 1